VPACAKVGTLGQHIVPGAPEKQWTGTKTNRNVPACAKVGTLGQQIVPEAPEKLRTGTKTNRNVPAWFLPSTPGSFRPHLAPPAWTKATCYHRASTPGTPSVDKLSL